MGYHIPVLSHTCVMTYMYYDTPVAWSVGWGHSRWGLSEPRVPTHQARTVCWTESVTSPPGIIHSPSLLTAAALSLLLLLLLLLFSQAHGMLVIVELSVVSAVLCFWCNYCLAFCRSLCISCAALVCLFGQTISGAYFAGSPALWSGARFTKYLTTIVRLSCNNAEVTIDLRWLSNLQNIARRTQGFS